jgi:ATP-dependent Lhr-like helicase
MERVAQYLGGWEQDGEPADAGSSGMIARPVHIVESAMERRLTVSVTMPAKGIRAMDKEAVWGPLVQRILECMESSRSVLIFVNNRRLCERLTLRLNEHVGYEMARSHHGSVSRERRLEVEALLKAGELRCLVATATLELGIDVGEIDMVLQIDSPKEAAAGIQRFGRAGHAVGGESRGVIIVRSRGDLPEAAVLAKAVAQRDIEDIRIPRHKLDVLSQHTVAAVAAAGPGEEWSPEAWYRVVSGSDCYREYPWERYEAMLDVLSGRYPFSRPLLAWDRETDKLLKLPGSAIAASMGSGTIPQTSAFPVHHAETRMHLGELDEEYVYESRPGDAFQLGASSWTIRSIRHDRVYVTESDHSYSEIPFWKAEAGGRSPLIGKRIGGMLASIRDSVRASGDGEQEGELPRGLMEEYRLDEDTAAELVGYVRSQDKHGLVPTDTLIVAEHYKDDGERHHLVVHSLLGRRIHRTWEMALRMRFDALSPTQVYSIAKDDGMEFVFSGWNPDWLLEPGRLSGSQLEELLWEALPGTAMFGRAFRRVAETSLLLARGYERQSSWTMRYRSEELLKQALPFADKYPYLREAYAVCLEEELDVPGLHRLLDDLRTGAVHLQTVDSIAPSPFAMRFMNDFAMTSLYESDALGRDVHMRLLGINRELAAEWFGREGLRTLISRQVLEEEERRLARPSWLASAAHGEEEEKRSLIRLLKEYGDLSREELSRLWAAGEDTAGVGDNGAAQAGDGQQPRPVEEILPQLLAAGSVRSIRLAGEERFFSRDEEQWYAGFPHTPEASFIAKRYVERVLSFRRSELEERFGVEAGLAEAWTAGWLEDGTVTSAPFAEPEETGLYTAAKIAERLVRTSISDYRVKHGAIEASRYVLHLLQTQHLLPERRLEGPDGLLRIAGQLQGIYLPVAHWEKLVFPARLKEYRKEWLDQLCTSGELFWMGRKEEGEKEGRIAFFLAAERGEAEPFIRRAAEGPESSQQSLLEVLVSRGASFLTALSRETGEPPSSLLPRLMELVWEGRAANDQFAPLRLAAGSASGARTKRGEFQSGFGRWYALLPGEEENAEACALSYSKRWMNQFGLLTRGSAAYAAPYGWEQLLGVLRKLEDWGMAVRGFFVKDIAAMQFTTRETVEQLEAALPADTGRLVLLSAVDPANPYGAWVEWPELPAVQFARKPGNFLVFEGNELCLWVENFGKHVAVFPGHPAAAPGENERLTGILAEVFSTIIARHHLSKITVERWNGRPAAESGLEEDFRRLGGELDRTRYVFWPTALKYRR